MIKERVQNEGKGQWQERTSRDETPSSKAPVLMELCPSCLVGPVYIRY